MGQSNKVTETGNHSGRQFWDDQYKSKTTGWDMGEVSPPLKAYIDQLTDKNIRILIPGCGNAYEVEYLLQKGFKDITVIDIAPTLVNKLKEKYSNSPHIKIILGDFFEGRGKYDLILEQTFFCALDPVFRTNYRDKMLNYLSAHGKLVGLLFDREFDREGPPFGGTQAEYEKLFKDHFRLMAFGKCYNSFHKREQTELFIILKKKDVL